MILFTAGFLVGCVVVGLSAMLVLAARRLPTSASVVYRVGEIVEQGGDYGE